MASLADIAEVRGRIRQLRREVTDEKVAIRRSKTKLHAAKAELVSLERRLAAMGFGVVQEDRNGTDSTGSHTGRSGGDDAGVCRGER